MNSGANSGELERILKNVVSDRGLEYRQANWLRVEFEDNIWVCKLKKKKDLIINFDVRINDGSSLIEQKNSHLLQLFKTWLVVQSHPDVGSGAPVSIDLAEKRLSKTLHLIDYILLNADRFDIAAYGLACMSGNDLRELLADLCSSNCIHESIYRWSARLTDFLRNNVLSRSELAETIAAYPMIAECVPPRESRMLDLDEPEVISARAWLWANGYYTRSGLNRHRGTQFRFSVRTVLLAEAIYSNTLRGRLRKPQVPELYLFPTQRLTNEYAAVPVTAIGKNMNIEERQFQGYVGTLESLGLLVELGFELPVEALQHAKQWSGSDVMATCAAGRHRTLPSRVVFSILSSAITYIIKFGDLVVDGVLEALTSSPKESGRVGYALPKLDVENGCVYKKLGVTCWSLKPQVYELREFVANPSAHADFRGRFKKNEGLWEMILVLYGAVAICVGTLMARRADELIKLHADTALDETRRYLIFGNAKSGVLGFRNREARPIPKIAARGMDMLIRLQDGMLAAGLISSKTSLFAFPRKDGQGLTAVCPASFYRATDLFCDYAETDVDSKGRRYYVRQHQLRRFFAMLFFWGASFGGMDTLRWFLGHTDVEHLYRYITESTPGAVLRGVKAKYAAEKLLNGSPEFDALADIIEEHFQTRQFSVLDEEELDQYIEELLNEGVLEIQPQFFKSSNGADYRIAVKVVRDL